MATGSGARRAGRDMSLVLWLRNFCAPRDTGRSKLVVAKNGETTPQILSLDAAAARVNAGFSPLFTQRTINQQSY